MSTAQYIKPLPINSRMEDLYVAIAHKFRFPLTHLSLSQQHDVRRQTILMTKQMWLLRTTFEDFVCIQYPQYSLDFLSSAAEKDECFKPVVSRNNRTYETILQLKYHRSVETDKSRLEIRTENFRSNDKSIPIDQSCVSTLVERSHRVGTGNKKRSKRVNGNGNRSILVSGRLGSMAGVQQGGLAGHGGRNKWGDCRGHIVGNNGCAYFCVGLRCQEVTSRKKTPILVDSVADPTEQTTGSSASDAGSPVGEHNQSAQHSHCGADGHIKQTQTSESVTEKNDKSGSPKKRLRLTKSVLLATYSLPDRKSDTTSLKSAATSCDEAEAPDRAVGDVKVDTMVTETRNVSTGGTTIDVSIGPGNSKFTNIQLSPATVSSGYESDFTPVFEGDIDKLLHYRKVDPKHCQRSSLSNNSQRSCASTEWMSNSDEHFKTAHKARSDSENVDVRNSVCNREKITGCDKRRNIRVQKQNLQLTKLSRSMYEIIHDLQADNSKMDNTGYKNRRQLLTTYTDMIKNINSNNVNSTNSVLGSLPSNSDKIENNQDYVSERVGDLAVNKTRNGDEPSCRADVCRKFSGEGTTLTGSSEIPGFRDKENIKMNDEALASFSGVFRANVCFSNPAERSTGPGRKSLNGSKPLSFRERWWQKRCDRYTSNVSSLRDDNEHIYETIPGDVIDEPQYVDINKSNLQTPTEKKFQRLPDLPGTFVPSDPPKLPSRKNRCPPVCRPTDNYVDMCEPLYSSVKKIPKIHTGVGQTLCDSTNKGAGDGVAESAYCHFNPLLSVPNISDVDLDVWSAADLLNHIDGIKQPAAKRRENLYDLLDDKRVRAQFSESLEIETRLKDMGVFDNGYSSFNFHRPPARSYSGDENEIRIKDREMFRHCYKYTVHQSDLLSLSPTNRTGGEIGLQYIQPTYV